MAGWAVVAADRGREDIAERRLGKYGLRVYLPRYRRLLAHRRLAEDGRLVRARNQSAPVLRPLLNGYLFAWLDEGQWLPLDPADRWRHWRAPWSRRRAYVSDAAIAILREAEQREGAQAAAPRVAVGDPVALEQWGVRIEGVVVALSGSDRAIIESIAGRRISAPVADLVSA